MHVPPTVCSDGNPCTVDRCIPPDGRRFTTLAEDGALCLLKDISPLNLALCKAGVCVAPCDPASVESNAVPGRGKGRRPPLLSRRGRLRTTMLGWGVRGAAVGLGNAPTLDDDAAEVELLAPSRLCPTTSHRQRRITFPLPNAISVRRSLPQTHGSLANLQIALPQLSPECVDRLSDARGALQRRVLEDASSSLFILFGP